MVAVGRQPVGESSGLTPAPGYPTPCPLLPAPAAASPLVPLLPVCPHLQHLTPHACTCPKCLHTLGLSLPPPPTILFVVVVRLQRPAGAGGIAAVERQRQGRRQVCSVYGSKPLVRARVGAAAAPCCHSTLYSKSKTRHFPPSILNEGGGGEPYPGFR